MSRSRRHPAVPRCGQRGVTLVELMVALVLGLVVSGAALALFVTNKQVYTTSENLDRMQESSRSAFELMARDLRESDGNPCQNEAAPRNMYQSSPSVWWATWGAGMQGYTGAQAFADDGFGTTVGKRVAGTQAVELWTAAPTTTDIALKTEMATTSATLDVSNTTDIAVNDILVICGPTGGATFPPAIQVTIFQATSVGANTIGHSASSPSGNISGDFGAQTPAPAQKVYGKGAVVSKLHAARWYIGYNGRSDSAGNKLTSLYRTYFNGTASTKDEIVEGVTDLQLLYHQTGGTTYDAVPTNWGIVDAVQVSLNLAGRDKVGTDKQTIKRAYSQVVAIRSRSP